MKKIIYLFLCVISFNLFAIPPEPFIFRHGIAPTDSDSYDKELRVDDLEEILNKAEDEAGLQGRKILEAARVMISNQEIILGSCWDFIDAAYVRAGYTGKFRKTVFKSKQQGPYADITQFEGGDWLYFINHSYGDVEHSSVFVAWTDKENKIALMISYAGGNQAKPARYKTYDLKSVYNIIRPR